MKNEQEYYLEHLIRAREMRHNPTSAEKALWGALRNRQLSGLKYYRQKPIGPLVVDFYCASARLVIEVDGEIHDFQKEYDAGRTEQLENYGFQVIRFRNESILDNLEDVLSVIKNITLSRISDLTPIPSPQKRGGEKSLS